VGNNLVLLEAGNGQERLAYTAATVQSAGCATSWSCRSRPGWSNGKALLDRVTPRPIWGADPCGSERSPYGLFAVTPADPTCVVEAQEPSGALGLAL